MDGQLLKKTAVAAPLVLAVFLSAAGLNPAAGQAVAPAAKAKSKTRAKAAVALRSPLDLNKASAEELVDVLPGVGEVTARKIVAGRPYASVDDLSRAGVPARTITEIRPFVTIAPVVMEKAKARERTKSATVEAAPTAKAGTTAPRGARINLNTATEAELQALPGIGPVHAREIVAARPFKSVDDLDRVKGLGQTRIDAIRDHVVLGAPPAPVTTPPATRPAMTKPATGTARPAAKSAATRPAVNTGRLVNLNRASREELDALPGIGPVKAQAIVENRPFKTVEDVMKVKGIKEGEFAKIKDLITVD